jgi:hypothetical protein
MTWRQQPQWKAPAALRDRGFEPNELRLDQ